MSDKRELIAVRGRDLRVATWLETLTGTHRVTALEGPRGVDPRRFGVPTEGSDWYVEGGKHAPAYHEKFLLLAPGMDRCGTVGFRCVK